MSLGPTNTPEPETIWVECPHCTCTFPTHDVGDECLCIDCERVFARFTNIVDEPEYPEWICPNCGRAYDERPDQCKCHRDGEQLAWLFTDDAEGGKP